MTVLASDDFNRADENPIAAPWTKPTGYFNNLKIVTNELFNTVGGTGDAVMYYSGPTWPADQYSKATQRGTNNDGGPAVRIGASSGNAYIVAIAGANLMIGKLTAGAFETLASNTGQANVAGDVWELRATGTTTTVLTVYRNGSQVLTYFDSTSPHTSGAAGMFMYDTQAWDNWEGGDMESVLAPRIITPIAAVSMR